MIKQQRSEGGANGSVAPFFIGIEKIQAILRVRRLNY